jgi:hypothetical protein
VECRDFDGQVVRLESIDDLADEFVRVRLTRIDDYDLNLFEFDYDLTIAVFFLNAEDKVYARYGGRDASSPDARQSIAGLRYTMLSVLDMHGRDGEQRQFAPRTEPQRKYARDVTGWYGGGCMHCHQVKEAINERLVRDGKWNRDWAWRFPLPENLGIRLQLDRGNVVEAILPGTPADDAGLEPGDRLETIGAIPIHSFADAQFALDKAPSKGSIDVAWLRGEQRCRATLSLSAEWKKSDLTWRASVRGRLVPSAPLSGEDLTAEERIPLGVPEKQLAFRAARLRERAKEAGLRAGDIVLKFNDKTLDMTVAEFRQYVRREFLVGDPVSFTVLRDGERLKIPLTLGPP